MFRSVSLAALIFSLALDVSSAAGVAAHSGTDTVETAGSSVMLSSPIFERRTISESSALLLMGLALLTASRAARR